MLAVGGDLKNTFCLADGHRAWMSAHLGDMDNLETLSRRSSGRSAPRDDAPASRPGRRRRRPAPRATATGRWAADHAGGRPVVEVQHHHAHVAAVMAEHGRDGPRRVIGVAFDGTGYGDDGAIWGGEVLLADYDGLRARRPPARPSPSPAATPAVRNPCRMALSHLRSAGIPWSDDLAGVRACARRRAAAARPAAGARAWTACPHLEHGPALRRRRLPPRRLPPRRLRGAGRDRARGPRRSAPAGTGGYPFGAPDETGSIDCGPLLRRSWPTCGRAPTPPDVAARFHGAVVALVTDTAVRVCAATGTERGRALGRRVPTRLLVAAAAARCADAGLTVLRHHLVPPTDGGLALGQVASPIVPGPAGHCPRGGPAAGEEH